MYSLMWCDIITWKTVKMTVLQINTLCLKYTLHLIFALTVFIATTTTTTAVSQPPHLLSLHFPANSYFAVVVLACEMDY